MGCINWISLVTGLIEVLLLSGVLYGWPAISTILKLEGVFGDLCNSTTTNTSISCAEQEQKYIDVHGTASLLLGFSCLLTGLMLDNIGLLVTRVCTGVCFLISFTSLAFAAHNWTLVWSFAIFQAFAALSALFTFLPLSRLFPAYSATIITVVNGIYDTSVGTTAIPLAAYNAGFTLEYVAFAYIIIVLGFLARSFVLLPVKSIPSDKHMENYSLAANTAVGMCFSNQYQTPSFPSAIENDEMEKMKAPEEEDENFMSYAKSLFQMEYLIFLYSYIILDARILMTFTIWPVISRQFFADDESWFGSFINVLL